MKSTTFVAVLLTLLSLLLIVGAAALFLFQGRRDFLNEINGLQESILERDSNLDQLRTTVEAQESELQTRQATLDQSLLQLGTRQHDLEEVQAALEALQETRAAETPPAPSMPVVDILSPTGGISVASDTELSIIVVAFAADGVERIDVEIGDNLGSFTQASDGAPYVVMRRLVSELTPGNLTITATLTTVDNRIQRSSIQIAVTEATPEPEETEEAPQGLHSAPVAELRR